MMAGLTQPSDLNYLGAFNVPQGQVGSSTFEYGGTALAYDAAHRSLFMVGHDNDQAVAEVAIPQLRTGALADLATANVLQSFTPLLGRVPNQTLDDGVKIGGLLVDNNRLLGTAYEYYDADVNAVDSHFTLSSTDLGTADVNGMYQVGSQGGGFVGGYMSQVPAQWQSMLGSSYVTGQAALSIIGRTSAGPALFGFNPGELGAQPASAAPLVEYPIDHPLAPETTQNPLFNLTTEIRGVFFPEGSDSVLFVGSHGIGPYWYGEADEGDFHDPDRPYKGTHAPNYVNQVWAYDVHDLIAVRYGMKQPWEIKPYATWTLDLPYEGGDKHIGGVAYDSASSTLYVSQEAGNGEYPVIHAFHVGAITDVNDAPVLNTSVPVRLDAVAEDTTAPAGTLVSSLVGGVSDMDANSLRGLAVSGVSNANGLWQYTTNGTTWINFGGPTRASARLLAADATTRIRFKPNANFSGTSSLYVFAWDQTNGSNGGTANISTPGSTGGTTAFSNALVQGSVSVTPVNDAPVLNTGVPANLDPIAEDTANPAGTLVSSLVGGVSDIDSGAVKGIAVSSVNAFTGTWQYTFDGFNWINFGSVSKSTVRLLPADATTRVRMIPNANYAGTTSMWFFAWDQSQGIRGDTANLSLVGSTGGTTAFSNVPKQAFLSVTSSNDAPVLGGISGSIGYLLGSSALIVAPFATVADVDSPNLNGGELRVRTINDFSTANQLELSGFSIDPGEAVMLGTTQIGMRTSDGLKGNELRITFNANATLAVVQQLLRSVTFRATAFTGPRTLGFSVSDGSGATSMEILKTVVVSGNSGPLPG